MTDVIGPRAINTGAGKARAIDPRTGNAGAINIGLAQAEIAAVRVYQWTIRPFIGANCRFWPSCSEYAVEALRTHGAVTGTAMAAKRILRCNPWNEGGVDPVPGTGPNMGH